GAILKQKKELLAPLDREEYFINDLIGLNVYNSDNSLVGKVVSVLSGKSADDLLEVKNAEGRLILIPFVEKFVPTINFDENKIVINSIPGLLDNEV
ncbi:MAG: ribosome maturation factor RimM, partial [Cyanobacteriota bacterium]